MGKQWEPWQSLFYWTPKLLWVVTAAMKLKMLVPWKKSYNKPRQRIKKLYFANKGLYSQSCGFSSSHVQMWELDHKEGCEVKWKLFICVQLFEPHGLYSPWNSPGQNTGVGSHSLLQDHSSKASILQHSSFLMAQLSHPYMTTGKTIALTIQTFVSKVMYLLFNTLSRFVIAFLPRSKCI